MNTHTPRLVAWLMLATLAAAAMLAPATAAPPTAPARPTLAVTTLKGQSFALKAQRGKWVIVNYWATWCSPCIKEMPTLSAFVAVHHDVVAVGLAYEDQPVDVIEAFLRKHPVQYPVARIDPMHPPQGIRMPSVLPTTLLIAPDGHLARTFIGPLDIRKLTSAIRSPETGS